MNPSNFVKNFRDVGESLFYLSEEECFPIEMLYRGGRLNSVVDHGEINNIPTIINLRSGSDSKLFDCNYIHIPAEDSIENYNTSNGKIRQWVNRVLARICEDDVQLPIFIHCTSGKDRTGVITAAILKVCGIPDELIVKEYLLSDGVDEAAPIRTALKGFGNISTYLKGGIADSIVKKFSV